VYSFTDPDDVISGLGDSGYDILRVLFLYDTGADVMYIGIDTQGLAGDADGDGDHHTWQGGAGSGAQVDPPLYGQETNLGLPVYESVGVALDFNRDGRYDNVVGVRPLGIWSDNSAGDFGATGAPGIYVWDADQNVAPGNEDYWQDSEWNPYTPGATITSLGIAPVSTTNAAGGSDVEFQINSFSLLSGSTSLDFDFEVFNGARNDALGEDYTIGTVPEPGSLILFALVPVCGLLRRQRRRNG
jgi:hypothetical protein